MDHQSYINYFSPDIPTDTKLSQFIKDNTNADDKIFVWGDHPFVYVVSNRLPVGKFTVAYHIVDFHQQDKTYEQLMIDFPKYIVYYPQENRPFSKLDNLISRYYRLVYVSGSALIYQHP